MFYWLSPEGTSITSVITGCGSITGTSLPSLEDFGGDL
jgi:hypothetical protein